MYNDWIADGKVTGCNPFYRHYLFYENERIPGFVGDSYTAKAFRKDNIVHLFWEELSSFGFEELGFESMDVDTFERLFHIG